MISDRKRTLPGSLLRVILLLIGLTALISMHAISFLFFHTLVELFSISIAFATFLIVWNAREDIDNSYLLLIGVAMLPIATIDLIHTLAYKGMNIFPSRTADLPTQLWIAARFLQASVMLLAPFMLKRRLNSTILLTGFLILLILLAVSIQTGLFPTCYIEGQGLTAFKITAEYVISAMLLGSIYILYRNRTRFDPIILRQVIAATIATIIAEVAFTFYIGVYDVSNTIGHIFKVVSFWFLYKALVETSVKQPIRMLVQNLKQSENALRTERDFSASIFNAAGALIVVLTESGKIIRANQRFNEISRLQPDQFLDLVFWEIPPFARDSSEIRKYFERTRSGENSQSYEALLQTAQGYRHVYRWSNTIIHSPDRSIRYIIAAGIDISEQKAAEEKLRFLSTHDALTGLYNRAFLETEMERLQQSRMFPISIIMADMDNLKIINDRFGHQAGDAALRQLSGIFTSIFRKEDIIARIGGDEFVALLPRTGAETAREIIARIETAHRGRMEQPGVQQFAFAIGCATAEEGADLRETLEEADQAMYAGKKGG